MNHKTILCIDDDSFYRDLFKAILEPQGYRVLNALNPEDGWKLAKSEKPDLITLDVMMPEAAGIFDGFGFLQRMRADEDLRQVPVLMISALGDREDAQQGMKLGATAYLPKQDMTPDELVKEIKLLL